MLSCFAAGYFRNPHEVSLEDLKMFFLILFPLGILVSLIRIVVIVEKRSGSARIPIETQFAFLISKQPGEWAKTPAIFQLDDGRRLQFMVDTYSTMIVGDRGVLTWKGNQFLNFERIG